MLCRHKAQGRGQMDLAHAGRAEKHHVLPVFREAHGGQLVDLALVDGGLEEEIEIAQSLLDVETGHLDLLLIGPLSLGFGLFRKDMIQNTHNVEVFCHRPFQVVVQNFQRVLHLQAFQVLP